jgi:PST family polysaccharide transporter
LSDLGLKRGILINFVAKYSNVFIQLILTSILARLLTPKEYGIIAVILIFTTFFNMLGDMGIGPAIIQYKDLKKDDISSIFIFTFIISIFLSVLFFAFSYLIAYFYNNSVYINIGHLLCFSIIFNLLNIVPSNLILKNKKFKIVALSNLYSNILAGILTIVLAYLGFSYYALVFNSIVQGLLNFLICYRCSRIKINVKKFSMKPIKRISHFSIYQFLFNMINYFSRNLDNLVIGKYMGMNALGYYDKSYKLMLYPVQNLTFVITPVLQPVLSEFQHEKDIILMHYKKIVRLLALMGAFITVFCFFSSKEIILIMYGSKWIGSVATFRILSISIVIQMVLSSSGSIFQATGNTKHLFNTGVISACTMISFIFIGLKLGKIEYLAGLLVLGFLLNFIQGYYILIKKVFEKSYLDFLKEFRSALIIMFIMTVFYMIIRFNIDNSLISIVIKLLIGLVSYALGLFITKEYTFIKEILFKRGKRGK